MLERVPGNVDCLQATTIKIFKVFVVPEHVTVSVTGCDKKLLCATESS